MMPRITMSFDVADIDPTLVDPHDVAEYLMGLYDDDHRAGNAIFTLAQESLEAEWEN